jgi:hypothetical protein
MSAFIVSDYHINALVSWAANQHGINAVSYYWSGRRREVRKNPKRIASVLYAENVRSVNARYSECDDPTGFQYKPVSLGYTKIGPVQVIKACHCLEYQSCEGSEWKASEAYAILDGIKNAAIRAIDGYDDADWELLAPSKEIA